MKVLVDTDILLDVALGRTEFFDDSAAVLIWAESHPGQASVAWHSFSNIAYLLKSDARGFIEDLLHFVEVAPVRTHELRLALGSPMTDLEDAMQVASAISFGARHVITRNLKDYRGSAVPAIKPKAFLALVT